MRNTVFLLVLVLGFTLPLGGVAEGYYTYAMTGQLRETLESNPLDRDYKRDMLNPENGTTYGMADVNKKYIKLWDRELNVIYQKLLLKLNDEEKELLIEAQVGWLQYHENEQRLTSKALSKNSGTIFIVQQGSAYRYRLRERTLQLMAYYHRLGGEVEFEYKGNAE
ncbi:lysozyme inhibitor LprI family protein [Anaeroselena agilis]|uniref:Lysozyme inhibitor LprI family protein n=1 Tax=Anaeroselena agilis TaxID=3063788 RepID=A0ABU3NVC2_9FIRM|nr:lysozyme inhibitor LprI family protein [Selenomonadales bacterium 4137-cl]